jgi:hypothetical protein
VRKLGELARELGRDDLLRRDASRIELLDASELIGLQPLRVSLYVADGPSSSLGPRPARKVKRTARSLRGCADVVLKLER